MAQPILDGLHRFDPPPTNSEDIANFRVALIFITLHDLEHNDSVALL